MCQKKKFQNDQIWSLQDSIFNVRIADYYLGCLNGSIFIDINLNENNEVYLKRISFDGYGCGHLNE
jgi:hypothetical protein